MQDVTEGRVIHTGMHEERSSGQARYSVSCMRTDRVDAVTHREYAKYDEEGDSNESCKREPFNY